MTATREDLGHLYGQQVVLVFYSTALLLVVAGLVTFEMGLHASSVASIAAGLWMWTCAKAAISNGYARAFVNLLPSISFDKPPLDERQYSDGEPVWGDS